VTKVLEQLAEEYDNKTPQEIIEYAFKNYKNIAISFSGAEDVVLIDMAKRIRKSFAVFILDTGRLHSETYQFVDRVREFYGIDVNVYSPDTGELEKFVREKGFFSFYKDGHTGCCNVRKVEPLRRALAGLDAWITGQRRDQSPNTRAFVPVVQIDPTFGNGKLIKFNPLSKWTSAQVWQYIRVNNVPYNRLHERGFVSIGCEPCTRAVLPGQHEREGRWWWEDAMKKECGLHAGNVKG